ncbi:MAG TPA: hypothetical protein VME17_05295 [Bryobacteraceae bacterium]|nr:hypothetical protein [Bryobacteraceae bacterium]
MTKVDLEAVIAVMEKWSIFFGILVAIGVTGESIVGFRLWRRNAELKAIQEREIAELAHGTATATRRAAELQLLIQPRELSDEQQHAITDSLKMLAGRGLLIGSHWNDVESARLARQIKGVLNNAGVGISKDSPDDRIGKFPEIPVGLFGGGTVSGVEIHTGIEIWGSDREVVATAFRSIGKLVVTTPQDHSPFAFDSPGLITIFVGVKPLPEANRQ